VYFFPFNKITHQLLQKKKKKKKGKEKKKKNGCETPLHFDYACA